MSSQPAHALGTRLRVCSFESRKSSEMVAMIERHGGLATAAPSVQEIPLSENPRAFQFGERLLAGDVDLVVFLTGVGARTLLEVLETRFARDDVLRALDRCRIVVRGPKPVAVIRDWGVHIDHKAPEPNTWREVMAVLDAAAVDLRGKFVAVQEYGRPSEELYAELEHRGAAVLAVPVYRWALPDDTAPLRTAIRRIIAGEFDVLLFTSAVQIANILTIAAEMGLSDVFLLAARRCFVGSIGPAATEALVEEGLPPSLEPTHPKMGHLVREALDAARVL